MPSAMLFGKVKTPDDVLFNMKASATSREVWVPQVGLWSTLLMYTGTGILIASLWHAQPEVLSPEQGRWGAAAFALYGLAYLVSYQRQIPAWGRIGAVLVMSLTLAAFNWVFAHLVAFTGVSLQVVTSLTVALVVPIRTAAIWITVQSCVLAWANTHAIPLTYAFLLYPTYILMNLFAAYLLQVVIRERQQRAELIDLNQQLRDARDAVAASAKEAERHRIARDLHDTLGHRLMALGLELEFASQVSSDQGRGREAVQRAQGINAQLLSEVRQTIRDVRSLEPQPLEETLRALGEQFPIQLQVSCQDVKLNPEQQEILLKCTREAMTNAVRHAGAQHVQLSLVQEPESVVLRIENDGEVKPQQPLRSGEGLRGMRERLQAIGGAIEVHREKGRFVLQARVPMQPA